MQEIMTMHVTVKDELIVWCAQWSMMVRLWLLSQSLDSWSSDSDAGPAQWWQHAGDMCMLVKHVQCVLWCIAITDWSAIGNAIIKQGCGRARLIIMKCWSVYNGLKKWPLCMIHYCFSQINAEMFTTPDLTNGYWQINQLKSIRDLLIHSEQ